MSIHVGSSPLTRGKPYAATSWWAGERLIPAHAGKTLCAATHRRALSAHPRSRGENTPEEREYFTRSGSSPLTRGKRIGLSDTPFVSRLIPAHAGKTDTTPPTQTNPRAHPRSRGENYNQQIITYRE